MKNYIHFILKNKMYLLYIYYILKTICVKFSQGKITNFLEVTNFFPNLFYPTKINPGFFFSNKVIFDSTKNAKNVT